MLLVQGAGDNITDSNTASVLWLDAACDWVKVVKGV